VTTVTKRFELQSDKRSLQHRKELDEKIRKAEEELER
jgi:hypothetical protein